METLPENPEKPKISKKKIIFLLVFVVLVLFAIFFALSRKSSNIQAIQQGQGSQPQISGAVKNLAGKVIDFASRLIGKTPAASLGRVSESTGGVVPFVSKPTVPTPTPSPSIPSTGTGIQGSNVKRVANGGWVVDSVESSTVEATYKPTSSMTESEIAELKSKGSSITTSNKLSFTVKNEIAQVESEIENEMNWATKPITQESPAQVIPFPEGGGNGAASALVGGTGALTLDNPLTNMGDSPWSLPTFGESTQFLSDLTSASLESFTYTQIAAGVLLGTGATILSPQVMAATGLAGTIVAIGKATEAVYNDPSVVASLPEKISNWITNLPAPGVPSATPASTEQSAKGDPVENRDPSVARDNTPPEIWGTETMGNPESASISANQDVVQTPQGQPSGQQFAGEDGIVDPNSPTGIQQTGLDSFPGGTENASYTSPDGMNTAGDPFQRIINVTPAGPGPWDSPESSGNAVAGAVEGGGFTPTDQGWSPSPGTNISGASSVDPSATPPSTPGAPSVMNSPAPETASTPQQIAAANAPFRSGLSGQGVTGTPREPEVGSPEWNAAFDKQAAAIDAEFVPKQPGSQPFSPYDGPPTKYAFSPDGNTAQVVPDTPQTGGASTSGTRSTGAGRQTTGVAKPTEGAPTNGITQTKNEDGSITTRDTASGRTTITDSQGNTKVISDPSDPNFTNLNNTDYSTPKIEANPGVNEALDKARSWNEYADKMKADGNELIKQGEDIRNSATSESDIANANATTTRGEAAIAHGENASKIAQEYMKIANGNDGHISEGQLNEMTRLKQDQIGRDIFEGKQPQQLDQAIPEAGSGVQIGDGTGNWPDAGNRSTATQQTIQKIDDLKQQAADAGVTQKSWEQTAQSFQDRVQELTTEIQKSSETQTQAKEAGETAQTASKSLDTQATEASQNAKWMETQSDVANKLADDAVSQIEASTKAIDSYQQQIKANNDKIDKSSKELKDANLTKDSNPLPADMKDSNIKELSDKIKNTEKENEDLNGKINEERNSLKGANENLERSRAAAENLKDASKAQKTASDQATKAAEEQKQIAEQKAQEEMEAYNKVRDDALERIDMLEASRKSGELAAEEGVKATAAEKKATQLANENDARTATQNSLQTASEAPADPNIPTSTEQLIMGTPVENMDPSAIRDGMTAAKTWGSETMGNPSPPPVPVAPGSNPTTSPSSTGSPTPADTSRGAANLQQLVQVRDGFAGTDENVTPRQGSEPTQFASLEGDGPTPFKSVDGFSDVTPAVAGDGSQTISVTEAGPGPWNSTPGAGNGPFEKISGFQTVPEGDSGWKTAATASNTEQSSKGGDFSLNQQPSNDSFSNESYFDQPPGPTNTDFSFSQPGGGSGSSPTNNPSPTPPPPAYSPPSTSGSSDSGNSSGGGYEGSGSSALDFLSNLPSLTEGFQQLNDNKEQETAPDEETKGKEIKAP